MIKESNEKKSKESIPKITHLSMQHGTELTKHGHPNKTGTPVRSTCKWQKGVQNFRKGGTQNVFKSDSLKLSTTN